MSWDHEAADKVVHLVDRWSAIVLGLATTTATVWLTLSKAIGPWLKRRRDMASLEKRSVNDWLQERVATLEQENAEWQRRWREEVRARARDSETYLSALEKLRARSSDRPQR